MITTATTDPRSNSKSHIRVRAKSRRQYRLDVTDADGQRVRYTVEWNVDALRSLVLRRARFQRGGVANSGPIKIIVHPDDRRSDAL
jgi:hypothetical protein